MSRLMGRVLLALLVFSSVGWAQGPEAPRDCDLSVRIQPFPDTMSPTQRAYMSEHPLFRLIGRASAQSLGFEPLKDLNLALEGTVVAGVMPSSTGGSSVVEFFSDHDARRGHTSMLAELDDLIADLRDYKESEGKYPTDYQVYIDEHRYYEPYLPDEAQVKYQALNDGDGFALEVLYQDSSSLGEFGPAPSYHTEDGRKNWSTQKPPAALNFVVAAKVKDLATARSLTDRFMGEPSKGFWRTEVEGVNLVATVRGSWWLLADRVENIRPFLDAVEGRSPGISHNPAYQKVARNIKMDSPFRAFINAPRIAEAILAEAPEELDPRLVKMVGPIGYSVIPYGESQTRIEVFVGVTPPQDSRLAEFFHDTANQDPESVMMVSNVPWDAANIFALDVTAFKELLDASVDLYPDLNEGYEMGQDVMAGMLGIDAEQGFNKLLQGPTIASFERIDIFLNGMEAVLMSQVAGDAPDPMTNALRSFPATIAVSVPNPQNRAALKKVLAGAGEEDPTSRLVHGVQVMERSDGAIAYAEDGDWLYLSGGHTSRLMRNMLAAAKGRKETLSSLPTWSTFQLGLKGRFLGFGHQKIDAVYSIVKGFILFLGADFRPLAMELGQLRDYHSVMTAVPDGFVMIGEIVKGDGR